MHCIDGFFIKQLVLQRNPAAATLLLKMVLNNAILGAPNSQPFFDPLPTSEMYDLLDINMVQPAPFQQGFYHVTELAMSKMMLAQRIVHAGNLLKFTRAFDEKSFEKCAFHTRWELMQILAQSGWKDVEIHSVSEVTPLDLTTPDFDLAYYIHAQRGILYHGYLSCLVLVQELQQAGVKKIYHFQPKAYYNAMIELCQYADKKAYKDRLLALLPNQTLTYYKELISRAHNGLPMIGDESAEVQTRRHAKTTEHMDLGLEDEVTLHVAKKITEPLRRGRGRGRGKKARGRTTGKRRKQYGNNEEHTGSSQGSSKKRRAMQADSGMRSHSSENERSASSCSTGKEANHQSSSQHGEQHNQMPVQAPAIVPAPTPEARVSSGSFFAREMGLDEVGIAKTARSFCGHCTLRIDKGTVRFSWFFSRKRPSMWLHEKCLPAFAAQNNGTSSAVGKLQNMIAQFKSQPAAVGDHAVAEDDATLFALENALETMSSHIS